MLNVVIIGAGSIGQYMASLLSRAQHNVILVDTNEEKLRQASTQMDVGTRQGSGTDWQLLDSLLDISPDFILALTDNMEVNLTVCTIAKHLGYGRTVARLKDDRFLNKGRLDFGRIFDVDYFVCPEVLVANDIRKYIAASEAMTTEVFVHGAVELKTLEVPTKWKKSSVPLSELKLPEGVVIGLIRRQTPGTPKKLIFPHGQDKVLPGDELTCIGEIEVMEKIHHFFGIQEEKIGSVVMAGGSPIAVHLTTMLKRMGGVNTKIIESNLHVCQKLAEKLPETTIVHQEKINLEGFLSEKVDLADLFVACSTSDEFNLMASIQAKAAGVKKIVAVLSSQDDVKMSESLDLSHSVSPRLATANQLLSWMVSDKVTSMVSLYENQVEVVEIQISPHSKVVGIPINELGPLLPKDFLIAVIQNRGRVMIANGNRILSPGDSVIVVTHPRHLQELNKIF